MLGYETVDAHQPQGHTYAEGSWHGLQYSAGAGESLLRGELDGETYTDTCDSGDGHIHCYPTVGSLRGYDRGGDDRGPPRNEGIPGPGALVETVELHVVCPSAIVSEQLHKPRCCSDSAMPGFVRVPDVPRNCPFAQSSYDKHECEPMTWASAHRVCASQSARLCTLEEVAHGCAGTSGGCAEEGELVWTLNDCSEPRAEYMCDADACQEMNVPCDPEDLGRWNASTLVTTVVADEGVDFTTHGWYIGDPGVSEPSSCLESRDGGQTFHLDDDCCAGPKDGSNSESIGDCSPGFVYLSGGATASCGGGGGRATGPGKTPAPQLVSTRCVPEEDTDQDGTREICDVSGCRDCTDAKCSSEAGDCLTIGAEPKTCLDGFVPLDLDNELFHTYTCCSTNYRAFTFGTGQGSQTTDPDQCSGHADCAVGQYCDRTTQCWECGSLNSAWCDSINGDEDCCQAELLAHCPLADWPDLAAMCRTCGDGVHAVTSKYALDYLYDTDDWRPEAQVSPLVLRIFGSSFLWVWVIFSAWGMSYVILCRRAPAKVCNPLPIYPYVGQHIGTGEHFQLVGGFANHRLESTPDRLVVRGNAAPCSCLPGRCGGFWLEDQQQVLPEALRLRGVTDEVWVAQMRGLSDIQKKYGRTCDMLSRLTAGGACCLHMPWYLTGICPYAWASNCFACCGCCWRCCCCCECFECCCFTCECCCPGASGFLGAMWHAFVYAVSPWIPWSRCDPFQYGKFHPENSLEKDG